MVETIYDECYNVLELLTNVIDDIYGEDIDKTVNELCSFLTTDSSRYEDLFNESMYAKMRKNKTFYKRIMMLIIVSTFYKTNVYYTEKGIDIDFEQQSLLEEKNYEQIIEEFYNFEKNPYIFQTIACFCDFINRNYIFKNNCMEEIIAQNRLETIIGINPFELLNFMNYMNPNMFSTTEKMIQDFIDLYDCSEESLNNSDQYEVFDMFKEKVNDHFNGDEKKVMIFYQYIFSNVYETIITRCKNNIPLKKRYKYLINEFLKEDLKFDNIYNKFLNNYGFADDLINFFLVTNDDLLEEDLIERRNYFKKVGNVDLLKKLNPFYEEEEAVFKKRKRYL